MSILTAVLLIALSITGPTDAEVLDRTKWNYYEFEGPVVIAYIKYNSSLNSKLTNYWRNRLRIVSEEFKDITFTVSDAAEFYEEIQRYGLEFNIEKKLNLNPIVIAIDETKFRYLLDTELTAQSLRDFVTKFKNGELIPQIKSEPIPDNTGRVVKEVVGVTFKEMVTDNPKDVFIMFYAHWCGYCKEALPFWKQFGEKMADEPNVDILQMDLFLNEVRKPFETTSYPTIFWIPSNNKSAAEKYLGERHLYSWIDFISKKSTKPLLNYERDGRRRRNVIPEELTKSEL